MCDAWDRKFAGVPKVLVLKLETQSPKESTLCSTKVLRLGSHFLPLAQLLESPLGSMQLFLDASSQLNPFCGLHHVIHHHYFQTQLQWLFLVLLLLLVVSEISLGSGPAFKVPDYDFRSPGELPLYLLLGALYGLVSLALSRCTSSMTSAVDSLNKDVGIPKAVFPVMGGLTVAIIAFVYPEVLYWGFENVDILLESRPFVKGLSAELLLQLVAVKIAATALCRASGPKVLFGCSKESSDDESSTNNLCEVESSLCIDDSSIQAGELPRSIFVSEAMRTRFATVMMSTSLEEAIARMLIEKQSCALIVDPDNIFLGLLTLSDSKARKQENKGPKETYVNEICSMSGGGCKVPWTVTPNMDLLAAQTMMNKHEISHVPVVSGGIDSRRIHPVGVLDRECITLTRRALATRMFLY